MGRIRHPYENFLKRFKNDHPPTEVRLFIELYPKEHLHYEALIELAMIGDLFTKKYDLVILLRSWNAEEGWRIDGDLLDTVEKKEIETRWTSFIKSFLFRRYEIPPNKIRIESLDSRIIEIGVKDTINLILNFGLDFQKIGEKFAEQEYWPWSELDEAEQAKKAKEEGLLSFLGLTAIGLESKDRRKSIVIRPASMEDMTKSITDEFTGPLPHPEYTDDQISLSQDEDSFLKQALNKSRECRKELGMPNEKSNNILNHHDKEKVVKEVVRFLLDNKRPWGASLFDQENRISEYTKRENTKEVILAFKEYESTENLIPLSDNFEFHLETQKEDWIQPFRTLVDMYQFLWWWRLHEGESDSIDWWAPGGFLKLNILEGEKLNSLYRNSDFPLKSITERNKLHKFVRDLRDLQLNPGADSWKKDASKILKEIIEFQEYTVKDGLIVSQVGCPSHYFKILSESPKIRFQYLRDELVELHHTS